MFCDNTAGNTFRAFSKLLQTVVAVAVAVRLYGRTVGTTATAWSCSENGTDGTLACASAQIAVFRGATDAFERTRFDAAAYAPR